MPRFANRSEYEAYAKARRRNSRIRRRTFPIYRCDKCGQKLANRFAHYNRCN